MLEERIERKEYGKVGEKIELEFGGEQRKMPGNEEKEHEIQYIPAKRLPSGRFGELYW